MKKNLTKNEKKLFAQFSAEVHEAIDHLRVYNCYPDRSPDQLIINKKTEIVSPTNLELCYEQIEDLLPKKGVCIDFIEQQGVFYAENYHEALTILIHPQVVEASGSFFCFSGLQELVERARKECNQISRSKKQSGLSCVLLVEATLKFDLQQQIKEQQISGRLPEPLKIETLANEYLGGFWDASQISKALKKINDFKNYKGYVAWFRRMVGQCIPQLPKDNNGKSISYHRVFEQDESLVEFESEEYL